MADNRSRIEKLVGMLGSDHDGEVLNAVRMIRRMAEAEKKSIGDLLLTGKERVIIQERVVYRDREPSDFGNRARGFTGKRRQHRQYRDWSEAFDEAESDAQEQEERAERARRYGYDPKGRFDAGGPDDILKGLRAAYEEAYDVLTAWEIEFAEEVYQRYSSDDDLSPAQVEAAERIIKKAKRANSESVI